MRKSVDWEALRQFRESHNPFAYELGIRLHEMQERRAEALLCIEEKHMNINGVVHGGVLMALADTAGGAACSYLDEPLSTVDLQYRFLRPVRLGDVVFAEAEVEKEGGSLLVVTVRLMVGQVLVGISTASFYRMRRKSQ